MKKHVMAVCVLILVLSASAYAGTILDIRTGVIPTGSVVDLDGAVVTAVQNNSFTVTELPAGPYTAIWVYQGASPAVSVGDVVSIKGLVRDNAGRSEINLLYPSAAAATVTASTTPPELFVTSFELHQDFEAWESHVVTITDGMIVQELFFGGYWLAASVESQLPIMFDDYFFDYATVELGDCYNNAFGMVTWYKTQWVFKVISVEPVDCTVSNDDMSFGDVKDLFR